MKRTWRRESVLDVYNLFLAILLIASPWAFKLTNRAGKMDLLAGGIVVGAVSLAAIAAYANWEEWANVAVGFWLVISPWLLGFTHTRAMHFSIGIGVVMAFFALLELWVRYDGTYSDTHQESAVPPANSHKH
jgi:hypothetical protein